MKYRVYLWRTTKGCAEVDVTAKDADEAFDLAVARAEEGRVDFANDTEDVTYADGGIEEAT